LLDVCRNGHRLTVAAGLGTRIVEGQITFSEHCDQRAPTARFLVTRDPDDAALVMAIITLAHNLRKKVIAEGIESEEQLAFLRLLRCDEGQGYFLGKPAASDHLPLPGVSAQQEIRFLPQVMNGSPLRAGQCA